MGKSVIITCIECPRGCRIEVVKESDGYRVKGNRCKRGKEYAVREAECPMRTLTTTVRTVFPDLPRLPVRTSSDIPLSEIFRFMEMINGVTLDRRIPHGAEIDCSLPGGVKLIITGDPRRECGDASFWERGMSKPREGGPA